MKEHIEYRVVVPENTTLYVPQYRYKLQGTWKFFQFLFPWKSFAALSISGELKHPLGFMAAADARAFLSKLVSPEKYHKELLAELERRRNRVVFQCEKTISKDK